MAKRKTLPTADAAAEPAAPAIVIEHLGRVRLEDISDSPFNPRKRYDGEKLRELADAYRRCAAQMALLNELEVDVADVDDHTARMLQRAENALREDLHPLDEADWFAGWVKDATVESIAAEIGKSPAYVSGRIKLASLITVARAELDAGNIGIGVAQLIAGLSSPDDQRRALEYAKSEGWEGHPPATDVVAEWITRELTMDLARAPWPLESAALVPEAGACATCPKRTGATIDLFAGVITGDRCLAKRCWDEKLAAHLREAKRAGELLEVTSKRGDTVKKPGAPLPTDCYKPVKPTQSDLDELRDHARDALVKDGPDKGQVRRVCAEPTCPVHGKELEPGFGFVATLGALISSPSSVDWEKKRAAENAKRELEEKVRLRALKLAIAKVKLEDGNLPLAELVRVADGQVRGNEEGEKRLEEVLGVKLPKKGMAGLERAQLSRSLLFSLFEWDIDGWRPGTELLDFAKRYKVDVAKIRAEFKTEEKVAAAAKASAPAKPAKKARAKAGAGR